MVKGGSVVATRGGWSFQPAILLKESMVSNIFFHRAVKSPNEDDMIEVPSHVLIDLSIYYYVYYTISVIHFLHNVSESGS